MKIIDFKLYQLPPRWLFLKIETDIGVCGWESLLWKDVRIPLLPVLQN